MTAIAPRTSVARVRMVVVRCMPFSVLVLLGVPSWDAPRRSPRREGRRVASVRPLESVDLRVESLAGLAAEDGGAERDRERRDQRDEAARRQGDAVDGQPREVQRVEHVVLRAADGGQGGDGDGDQDAPQPYADALTAPVEARHAPCDVAAEEVADGEHDEQRNPAGEAD